MWRVDDGLCLLQVTTIQEALAIDNLREGAGSRREPGGTHHASAHAELAVEAMLGNKAPRAAHAAGAASEYDVPSNAVRIRGRGDVRSVAYVRCHAPPPPSPPYPPPSPRPDCPPAWWLISPPPPLHDVTPRGDSAEVRAHGGSGHGEPSLMKDVAKEVRHMISSGVGFVIVVGVFGVLLLVVLLVQNKKKHSRELADRDAALAAVKVSPKARVRGGGGARSANGSPSGKEDARRQSQSSRERSESSAGKAKASKVVPPKAARGPRRAERRGATRVPGDEDEAEAAEWVRRDDDDDDDDEQSRVLECEATTGK